ncbi:MAG: FtsX-like permease family protein [Bacteroidales bacterium]
MIKRFFIFTMRYLWRNKTYSLLNFLCLTFGLTCATIAVLHILIVLSYDKFNKNYERLCCVESYVTYFNGARFPKEYQSASLTDKLNKQIPEIEETVRVAESEITFVSGNKSIVEHGIYADNNFMEVFTFPLVRGNKLNKTDLNTILISEKMARKFFGNSDCTGKQLLLKSEKKQEAYKIAGVLKDVPTQSYLQFDFIIPFAKFLADNEWANESGASSNQVWALLKKNVDRNFVNNKIKNLIKNQEATLNQELFLFPLKEKILYSYAAGKRVWNEMQNVVIVGSIGFAILLIACFNFINLAIAVNIRRHREAGIKKVMGSKKRDIIFQFLGETFFITLISFVTAIFLTNYLLSAFNTMFNKNIVFSFTHLNVITIFLGVAIFTGLVSGLLPALYLGSSNPVNTLKGKISTGNSFGFFRQGLIVFQYTIPVVLIISMMIIKEQDKYMRNYDIGMNKEKVIILDNTDNIRKHSESVKTELLSIPGIEAVSFTSCIPSRGTRVSNEVSWDGKDDSEKLHFWCVSTDYDYNKIVDLKIIEGRYFDKNFPSDSSCYLINDEAARVMKYKNPAGSTITLEGKKGSIIGVFTDFHAIDLAGPIVPTIITLKPQDTRNLLIKFSSGDYKTITDKISGIYKHYEPENDFRPMRFADLAEFSELNLPSKLVGLAFVIAILLACMGLYGLASFTAESRTKEIGIRKANGAKTISIMYLLLSKYSKWLGIASLLAVPIAFILGKFFLGNFFFHAQMPLWAFIAGPLIACIIAISTVSWQSWKAASRNPVESLRYE